MAAPIALGMVGLSAGAALAATAFEQGFETGTSGWEDQGGTITRVASDTGGVASASGQFHAIVRGDNDNGKGPFTRLGGYNSTWPGDWSSSLDVYLTPSAPLGSGFDYSVAVNNTSGVHHRDFFFHLAKDTSTESLLVNVSSNTDRKVREDLDDPSHFDGRVSIEITTAGWYTLQWDFKDVGGALSVDHSILDAEGTALVEWNVLPPGDTIGDGGVIGGNRYGDFLVISHPDGFAIDNTLRTVPVFPPPDAGDIGGINGAPPTGTPPTVEEGQEIELSGSGFKPGSSVDVVLYTESGEAITIATATADADGNVTVVVTIPAGLEPGTYQLALVGLAPDNTQIVQTTPVVIAAEPTVPTEPTEPTAPTAPTAPTTPAAPAVPTGIPAGQGAADSGRPVGLGLIALTGAIAGGAAWSLRRREAAA